MNQERIGKFIATLRKEKKLTQLELATKIGVTDRAISKWENGRGMPDLSLLVPLCNELDISINELLSGERLSKKEYQKELEENIINMIKYSDDKIKKGKRIVKVILSIIVFLILSLFIIFCIDMYRMKNGEAVLLSTWGYDYTPTIDLNDEMLEITIEDYLLSQYDNKEDEKRFVSFKTFLIEEEKRKKLYNVYIWSLEGSYYLEDDEIKQYSGLSMPYKFVISRDGDNYKVENVRYPRDGTDYPIDIREIFPKSVERQIWKVHEDGTIERLELDIERKVSLYFMNRHE